MLLQLACDGITSSQTVDVLKEIQQYVDIVEIGTPLMIREGVSAVEKVKNAYPNLKVLADIKIIDGGDLEASLCFDAGADIVTIMAFTTMTTIKSTLEVAARYGREMLADMMQIPNIVDTAKALESIGMHYIAIHASHDAFVAGEGPSPHDELKMLSGVLSKAKLSVAGGISPESAPEIALQKPDVIIVGSGILSAKDPVLAAKTLRSICDAS